MDPPLILTLAGELIDQILHYIDLRRDLINFACTSRTAASHVIPRHLEYRVLKIGSATPTLWEHLASRPDLALSVREVEFTVRDSVEEVALERIPTSYITEEGSKFKMPPMTSRDIRWYRMQQVPNMIKAFEHMKYLQSYWCTEGAVGLTKEQHMEEVLIALIKNKPDLKRLMLCSHFDEENRLCDARRLGFDLDLTHMSIQFSYMNYVPVSAIYHAPITFGSWIPRSNLVFLYLGEVRVDDGFCDLVIPSLKSFLISQSAPHAADGFVCRFLENNPSIEDISWFPHFQVAFAPGTLPNLKQVRSYEMFMSGLEEAYHAAPTPTKYKIKNLHLLSCLLDTILLKFECLDRLALKEFRAGEEMQDLLPALGRFADAFPNVEVLQLPRASSVQLTLAQWYEILPRFANLQTLPYLPLVGMGAQDEVAIWEMIVTLAKLCPQLKHLPAFSLPSRGNRWRYAITRTVVDGEQYIEYKPQRIPRYRRIFWIDMVVKYFN